MQIANKCFMSVLSGAWRLCSLIDVARLGQVQWLEVYAALLLMNAALPTEGGTFNRDVIVLMLLKQYLTILGSA